VLKFNSLSSADDKKDSKKRFIKIRYEEFKKSDHTMQMIKQAGLEEKIERAVEVEDNYQIKKIVGYGSTCTVYKAHYFKHGNPKNLMPQQAESDKQVVAIKKVKDIF
jgi:hypothetical protein